MTSLHTQYTGYSKCVLTPCTQAIPHPDRTFWLWENGDFTITVARDEFFDHRVGLLTFGTRKYAGIL
jgi:hypothetical protein